MTEKPDPNSYVLDALRRSRDDARIFVREVLSVRTAEPWQIDALKLISEGNRVAIRSGHGAGKTTLIVWLLLWFLLTRFPCKIPVAANSEKQLRDTIWPEISIWIEKLPKLLRDEIIVEKERVYLKSAPEQAFAVARTASKDNPEALQGFHAENILFLIEEASGLADIVFEVAMGALSTPNAKIIMVGNPTRLSGFFYNAFHKNRSRWKTMRVNSEDVPRATGHIEDIIQIYGKDSNAYRIRVLGDFPTTEDEQVIPLEWIEASLKRKVEPSSLYRVVWGLDVARFGDDRSALAKRRGNVVLEPIKSWRKCDTMQTCGKVMEEWKNTPEDDRPSEILVDVIGIGAGVSDRLMELGLPARGINVGERPAASDRFSRLRDELWFKMRDWFGALNCKMPDDRELIEELSTPQYTFTSAGKIVVERKDEMKSRIGKSPDLADSLILTLAGGLDIVEEAKPERYRKYKNNPTSYTWMGV